MQYFVLLLKCWITLFNISTFLAMMSLAISYVNPAVLFKFNLWVYRLSLYHEKHYLLQKIALLVFKIISFIKKLWRGMGGSQRSPGSHPGVHGGLDVGFTGCKWRVLRVVPTRRTSDLHNLIKNSIFLINIFTKILII